MSEIFGSVNEVDSHKNSRQSDLAMEKLWVAQCGWLRLCTTAAMGMTITNCWKLFRYGVKRDHYNSFISIRELLERINVDCFSNTFKTDKWMPEKNIPSLDDIDNEGNVSTFHIIKYSSSYPPNSEISTISDITIATDTTTAIGRTASKEF